MIKDFFKDKIKDEFGFVPTSDQDILLNRLGDFASDADNRQLLLIKGYAGTGKTSLVSAFVRVLKKMKLNHFLLAPTGRAAKVFSSYSGAKAYTIHKEIYIQKSSGDGFGTFVRAKNLRKNTIFIVDEASMIANQSPDHTVFGEGRLLDDLFEYVYSGTNCRLILMGDPAQLPPVGTILSPALDAQYLSKYIIPIIEVNLTQVVRQAENSGILCNATFIRNKLVNNDIGIPEFKLENFNDIHRIGGAELIEVLSDSYSKYGIEENIVVCRSNKRANRFNQGIRNQILGREEEISTGDLLMVVKNNYFWAEEHECFDFIANGDIVEIVKIREYIERYGFRFADIRVKFSDYNNFELDVIILLNALNIESAALPQDDNKKLFFNVAEDYSELKSKKKIYEKVREDPFFNALQVKFAYAVTCHKAQGGQWKTVFVDQGFITPEMIDTEFLRWLYTALTRPSGQLFLVNFNKEFFGEK